jgi:hypothetical protein
MRRGHILFGGSVCGTDPPNGTSRGRAASYARQILRIPNLPNLAGDIFREPLPSPLSTPLSTPKVLFLFGSN